MPLANSPSVDNTNRFLYDASRRTFTHGKGDTHGAAAKDEQSNRPTSISIETDMAGISCLALPSLSTKSRKTLIEVIIEGGDPQKAFKLVYDQRI